MVMTDILEMNNEVCIYGGKCFVCENLLISYFTKLLLMSSIQALGKLLKNNEAFLDENVKIRRQLISQIWFRVFLISLIIILQKKILLYELKLYFIYLKVYHILSISFLSSLIIPLEFSQTINYNIPMLKILGFTKTFSLSSRIRYNFSSFADPYYILGVQKSAPFPEIKKAFYKLANEFHPDKNQTKQAEKKFVIIKQAFEAIKMEKGMIKPQPLYRSDDRQSMRPNPQKYSSEQQQNQRNFRDYTMFRQKAQTSQQYSTFATSFNTINNINDIKIKVQEGQMKDPISRFGLQKFRVKISSYSEGGNKYLFIILTGLVIFTVVVNQVFSEKQVEQKESALKKLTAIHKRKTIQSDLVQNKKIDLRNIERSKEIVQIKKQILVQEIKSMESIRLIKDKVISPQRMEKV